MEAFTEMIPAPSFLRDKLFGITSTTTANQILVDFYYGDQLLAPFCARHKVGIVVPRNRYRSSLFEPGLIRPVRVLSADDTYYRQPGEPPTVNRAQGVDRDAALLVQDSNDLDAEVARTEEWMCAQCLFQGIITCEDADDLRTVATIDYRPLNVTAISKLWTDPTSNPLGDLKIMLRAVSASAGGNATLVVLGSEAADAFESNPNVVDSYNKLNYRPGTIEPKLLEEIALYGVSILGTYRNLPIYTHEALYVDHSGAQVPFVPPKMALVACNNPMNRLCFAGIRQTNEGETGFDVLEGPRIPCVWMEKGEDVRYYRVSSRPVPVPNNTKSWTVATVC
jgi:hypothetical protein